MSLFNFKGDRYVIELTIEFNLTAIDRWLSSDSSDKTGREHWDAIEKIKRESWDSTQPYHIDILPNGQLSDMYFHRKKSIISNRIDGFEAYSSEKTEWFSRKIEIMEWSYWRGEFLSLKVNLKPVFLAPLAELVELQAFDKLKKYTGIEGETIKVPVVFDSPNGKPTEFTEVFRTSAHPHCVGYKNALASVYAQTSGFIGRQIEY